MEQVNKSVRLEKILRYSMYASADKIGMGIKLYQNKSLILNYKQLFFN